MLFGNIGARSGAGVGLHVTGIEGCVSPLLGGGGRVSLSSLDLATSRSNTVRSARSLPSATVKSCSSSSICSKNAQARSGDTQRLTV